MGFFDSLKKLVDTAEAVSKQLNSSQTSAAAPKKAEPAASGVPVKKTPQNIIDSGNIAAKPSVKRETTTFGGEDANDEINVSFMLSGDFIEFDSHCEMMPSFQYEPYNNESYTEYLESYPKIFIGPYDDVYDAVENNRPIGTGYEKLDNKYFAFKTKLNYYGEHLYCYAFRDGTAREREMFGLTYNKDIEGTPLEKKLMAALDEAASTYTETKIN